MSYPKPLSERSLQRLYAQAGLSAEVCDFFHALFAACASLYGAIALRDVWAICQRLKNEAPYIRRRDLIAFSAIVRREVQPYRVYEIEELYTEEAHNELDRHIVSRELIGTGYGKLAMFYTLMDERSDHPYCIPDDLLSYATPIRSAEERAMADFIGGLKSVAAECVPEYGNAYPNENRGKRLREFSFFNASERASMEHYRNKPAVTSALLEDYGGTEAEKLMRLYMRAERIGDLQISQIIQYMGAELHEVGVRLTKTQLDRLVRHITETHNHSRLWCICGWKPSELARMRGNTGRPSISFGPGLQNAFANGTMDKDELVRKIQELGLKVTE